MPAEAAVLPPVLPPVLPDVLASGLRVVFCGSAAGRVSAALGAYYAHPQNRFWPMLAKTGLTPRLLAPREYPLMPALGLGFTDVCKVASGADSDLPAGSDDPEAVRAKVEGYRPRLLAFVGKRPAGVVLARRRIETGLQDERIGETRLFVLPSPSGLACRYWDEAPWFALAALAGPTPALTG